MVGSTSKIWLWIFRVSVYIESLSSISLFICWASSIVRFARIICLQPPILKWAFARKARHKPRWISNFSARKIFSASVNSLRQSLNVTGSFISCSCHCSYSSSFSRMCSAATSFNFAALQAASLSWKFHGSSSVLLPSLPKPRIYISSKTLSASWNNPNAVCSFLGCYFNSEKFL